MKRFTEEFRAKLIQFINDYDKNQLETVEVASGLFDAEIDFEGDKYIVRFTKEKVNGVESLKFHSVAPDLSLEELDKMNHLSKIEADKVIPTGNYFDVIIEIEGNHFERRFTKNSEGVFKGGGYNFKF